MRWPARSKARSGTNRTSGSTSGASAFGSRMPHWPRSSRAPNSHARKPSDERPDPPRRHARGGAATDKGWQSEPHALLGELLHQRQRIDLALERHEAGDNGPEPNRQRERPRGDHLGRGFARVGRQRIAAHVRLMTRALLCGLNFSDFGHRPSRLASSRSQRNRKCGAALAVGALIPGTYISRWAPYDTAQG